MFIPHHARQMGPIYFLVPRKVQLFGVRVDGVPRQYNYLIDKDETIGKHIETYNSEIANAFQLFTVLRNCPPPPSFQVNSVVILKGSFNFVLSQLKCN